MTLKLARQVLHMEEKSPIAGPLQALGIIFLIVLSVTFLSELTEWLWGWDANLVLAILSVPTLIFIALPLFVTFSLLLGLYWQVLMYIFAAKKIANPQRAVMRNFVGYRDNTPAGN
ncbi:hypothetical protein NBH20_06705 [Rhizobium sp. S153]|uniref:DUF983 domain-containing protein n=1 Tax=Ciceribacter sichuanensis TaxID=2949647 RepID=A0ABT0V4M2_9HYPH|nr:hypothetical protein [Ciceribacter sp. S153]MCM2400839.1 hypothetical protein [Ciceribacter sp. S153]